MPAERFGRASFLLDWHGRGGAFVYQPTDGGHPTGPADELGKPLRRKIQLAPGVWRRRFERGVVVVNATSVPVAARVFGPLRQIGPTDAVIARR